MKKPLLPLILLITTLLLVGCDAFEDHSRPDLMNKQGLFINLPIFSYKDLNARRYNSNEWRNNILVLNFWASWCPPCRKETPAFIKLQEEFAAKNVQFVGIAIDDPIPVQDFIDTYGIEYPVLLGDEAAVELSNLLGNRFSGLPFTIVTSAGGKIELRKMGELGEQELRSLLEKLTQPISDKQ